MLDFLGIFKPVTEYCMDNFGLFGMFLAMAAPVVALALAAGVLYLLVVLVGALVFGSGVMGAKQQRKKADKLRAAGKYEEALDIYVRIHKKHKDKKIVTRFEIGMLCKEGEASGWLLEDEEASPGYWFKQALNPFNAATYYEYGMYLIENAGTNLLSAAEGAKHIHQAARLGHTEAKEIAEKQDRDAKSALARADYRTAASLGNADAQYIISIKATGAEKIGWLELAADEKHLEASEELGKKYVQGDGVKENLSKAVTYLTPAAEAGSMNAQAFLGLVYNNKYYPRRSEEAAIKWYTLAANQGHPYAMHNLAVIYAQKMDEYAKAHNLNTRLDRAGDHTYMRYFMEFSDWKRKAEEHGVKAN